AFWAIMGSLFRFDYTLPYDARIQQLINNNIALWDVIEKCHRPGSLDTSIVTDSITVNDFVTLFTAYPTIEFVFFNGGKAEAEFRKRVLPIIKDLPLALHYELLPSTSPANAKMTKAEKLARWKKVQTVLAIKK
ncbi:MAG: DNA-deoxyinosine glycosylase, partial [Gammaproteobacteria bacterium]|nr:DNA-deoxyinosine glycosylase [Gammaproteobacteria bacterium]